MVFKSTYEKGESMCGITGFLSEGEYEKKANALKKMNSRIMAGMAVTKPSSRSRFSLTLTLFFSTPTPPVPQMLL